MATVFIPALLRDLIGEERVVVTGSTVGDIIRGLDRRYPGTMDLLVEDDDIMSGVAIVIDDQVGQMGLFDPVTDETEIHILPALSGGAHQAAEDFATITALASA
ncbi:MAG: MoaD/ThiS family protein [Dehalococcoidia bacterium]